MNIDQSTSMKPIRSFVRRQGRMTIGQQRALTELWPKYGCSYQPSLIKLCSLFGNDRDCVLEIGFGNGASLLAQATAQPEINFLGVEVHGPGIGSLLQGVHQNGLKNVRVIQHDAIEVIKFMLEDNSLAKVQLFFPDPWPKKRHHKRRIVQSGFVNLVASKLKLHGCLHMATDWQPYAEYMLAVMTKMPGWENTSVSNDYVQNVAQHLRPNTKFEQRGARLGHGVWDLVFSHFG